jgi:hypothetical protein
LDAPNEVSVTIETETKKKSASIVVDFNHSSSPSSEPIHEYIVHSVPAGFTARGSSSPIRMPVPSSFVAGSTYSFYVEARNEHGISEASDLSASIIIPQSLVDLLTRSH